MGWWCTAAARHGAIALRDNTPSVQARGQHGILLRGQEGSLQSGAAQLDDVCQRTFAMRQRVGLGLAAALFARASSARDREKTGTKNVVC